MVSRKPTPHPSSPTAAPQLFLAIASLIVFFYGAGALPFVGADEPRYARAAFEMLESSDWVVPHLEGRPWLEKPPLYYWTTALSFKILGSGEAQARLASALAMLGMVTAVYAYGRRWFSERVGWLGAMILATTIAATAFARAASMDALFSFLIFLGLCAFVDAMLLAGRWARVEFVFSALCLGAAILAKGLLGILLPIGILVVYLIWTESWSRLSWTRVLLWCAVTLLVAAPWHVLAFRRAGFDFLATYLVNHHLARFFTELHHHAQPVYYYLGVLLAGFLPWSLLLPLAFKRTAAELAGEGPANCRTQLLFLLRLSAAATLVLFSLSASKLPGYILPAFPPLALLIAIGMDSCAASSEGWRRARVWMLAPAVTLGAVMGTAIPTFLVYRYSIPVLQALVIGIVLWCGSLAAVGLIARQKPSLESCCRVIAGSFVVFVLLLSTLCSDEIGLFHSTRDVARKAVSAMKPGDLLASYRFFHHTLGYYSEFHYVGNWETAEKLKEGLSANQGKTVLLVTEPRRMEEIQQAAEGPVEKLDMLGRFGPRVLLRLTPSKTLQ